MAIGYVINLGVHERSDAVHRNVYGLYGELESGVIVCEGSTIGFNPPRTFSSSTYPHHELTLRILTVKYILPIQCGRTLIERRWDCVFYLPRIMHNDDDNRGRETTMERKKIDS